MRTTILLILLSISICATACADKFVWTEDFEGDLADYWILESGNDGFIGLVEDPENPDNQVLCVNTYEAGWAVAKVLMTPFYGLDDTQEVTASFRFYVEDDNYELHAIATNFTGTVGGDSGVAYSYGEGDPIFESRRQDHAYFQGNGLASAVLLRREGSGGRVQRSLRVWPGRESRVLHRRK